LNDNQWGPPSGASILNPIFLAFNAQDVDELAGSIEGAFPWTNANFTGGVSESPWQWFNTRDSIVNRITPMSYMNGYYYKRMNWHGGPMQYFMGGALRGFDDHKGHSWATLHDKRYIANDSGATLNDSFALFENQSMTGTPVCFVVEWPEYKEGTGVDPN